MATEPELPPPYSPDWAEAGRRDAAGRGARGISSPIDAGCDRPGDVLLFRWRDGLPAKHCAIATSPRHDGACP